VTTTEQGKRESLDVAALVYVEYLGQEMVLFCGVSGRVVWCMYHVISLAHVRSSPWVYFCAVLPISGKTVEACIYPKESDAQIYEFCLSS
jgi:hypothetical protein